ncbi:hypothetical protein COY95_00610 [Candidatus Woesearchaeota archaeon CG_4_10_14_0_8_um_filter_47_5]|nr:MAG: hypothetical protein COY95_00610 [Candidatus Woesearchaeota archaeon CG_4_10_14_0_8_um_filter_47_5]
MRNTRKIRTNLLRTFEEEKHFYVASPAYPAGWSAVTKRKSMVMGAGGASRFLVQDLLCKLSCNLKSQGRSPC